MTKLISIIIPMYNCAGFVGRVIEELGKYNSDDVEILLVNDGSKDNTLEVAEKYAAKDSRINVIDKENGGVSSARNAGLEKARGKYVWFVDADDSVTENALTEMKACLEKNSTDMLLFDFLLETKAGCTGYKTMLEQGAFVMENGANEFIMKKIFLRKTRNTVWNVVFKRDIIEKCKISFALGVTNGEDGMFFMEYTDKIASAEYVEKEWYVYNKTNESSATRNITPVSLYSIIEAYKVKIKYIGRYCDCAVMAMHRNRLVYSVFKNFVGIKWNPGISDRILKKHIEEAVHDSYLTEEFEKVNEKQLSLANRFFLKLFKGKKVSAIYSFVVTAVCLHGIKMKLKRG